MSAVPVADSNHSGSPASPTSRSAAYVSASADGLRHARSHSSLHSPNGEGPSAGFAAQIVSWGPQSGPHGTPLTIQVILRGPAAFKGLRKASVWFGAPGHQGGRQVAARVASESPSSAPAPAEEERRLAVTGFVPQLENLRNCGPAVICKDEGNGEDVVVRVGLSVEGFMDEMIGLELGDFRYATGPTGMTLGKRLEGRYVAGPGPVRPMSTPVPQGEFQDLTSYRRGSLTADDASAYGRGPEPVSPHLGGGWNGAPAGNGSASESNGGSPIRGHARTPSATSSGGGGGHTANGGSAQRGRDGSVPGAQLRHPPDQPRAGNQPSLLRTTQIANAQVGSTSPSGPGPVAANGGGGGGGGGGGAPGFTPYTNRAVLNLQGDLSTMAMGWTPEEWAARRRLVQFWRKQEGNTINATFTPIAPHQFIPNSIVVSCIFREDRNECFITSVDTIYLLEALVGVRFTVEEKNRIRRNLEGFRPVTVSKSKVDSEPFFKLIMSFPNPKPRNIEKDVKVFQWKNLGSALQKILSKYSATYSSPDDQRPVLHSGPAPSGNGEASPTVGPSGHFAAPGPGSMAAMNNQHAGPHHSHSDSGQSNQSSPIVSSSEYGHRSSYDLSGMIHHPHPQAAATAAPPPVANTSPFSSHSQAPQGGGYGAGRGPAYSIPYGADASYAAGGHSRSLSDSQWNVGSQPRQPLPLGSEAYVSTASPFAYDINHHAQYPGQPHAAGPGPAYYGPPGDGGDDRRANAPHVFSRSMAGGWGGYQFPAGGRGVDGRPGPPPIAEASHE